MNELRQAGRLPLDEPGRGPTPQRDRAPAREVVDSDRYAERYRRILAWLAVLLAGLILVACSFRPGARSGQSSPSPTSLTVGAGAAATATPMALAALDPEPVLAAATAFPTPTPPTPPPGGIALAMTPAPEGVGWTSSLDGASHFGDFHVHAGVLKGQDYLGALQFDLSGIPPGSTITAARLELAGLNDRDVGTGGAWALQVVDPAIDRAWPELTHELLAEAEVEAPVPPTLRAADLAWNRLNVFLFDAEARSALQRRLRSGTVSFRIVGPAGPGDNLFTWDSGYGNGAEVGSKPLLRIVALAPTPRATPTRELAAAPDHTPTASPTATYVIITSTPAPENLLTVVPIAATSTALAETMGSPTPLPANWVTPVIVTSTPTPENEATATFAAAIATAWVTLYGTPSPLPENVWTATPEPTATPGPPPAEPAAPPPAPDNPPPVVVVPDSPPPVVVVPEPSAPPATETPIPTPTELPLIVPVEQLPPTATEVAVPTTTPVPAVLPAELRGKILFLSDRTGGTDVFVMNPDGTGVGLLTEQWPYDRAVELDSFSPDRGQRLFVQPAGNYFEIWVQNTADGWTYRLIGGPRVTYDPAWSPDSVHVAYVSQESGNDEIYVLDKDTAEERRLTHNQWEWDKHPSWSPDGTKIVFWSNRDTSRSQIWVMNADGNDPRNLSNNQFNDWDPVWVK